MTDDKPIIWISSSKEALRRFPKNAQRKAGFELRAVQQGDEPSDTRSMPTIGKGVKEIRIRTQNAHRVFYVAKFQEAVYVLHAFEKKTQKTSKRDIQLGRQRYKDMLHERKERGYS
jgi:phage-related protein